MRNRVVLTTRAVKGLEGAPGHVQRKATEAIDALQETFAPVKSFDVKKLKGVDGAFRIRIGGWRIIYEFHRTESLVVVLDVAPRGGAY